MNPSSIWTQSNSSIFSHGESSFSATTQWTSQAPDKLEHQIVTSHNAVQQAPAKQNGRPPNKWTSARLRHLIKLYLLTDSTLEDIINSLCTADFQPCKRDVQERLKILLQPQPRTIRPKGDTSTFRSLLRQCNQLQEARRRFKRQRRRQLERTAPTHKHRRSYRFRRPPNIRQSNVFWNIRETRSTSGSVMNSPDTDSQPIGSFDPGEIIFSGIEYSGASLQYSLAHEELQENVSIPDPRADFEFSTLEPPSSTISVSPCDWPIQDSNFRSQHLEVFPQDQSCNHSLYSPAHIHGNFELFNDFHNDFPDIGFDSEFGSRSFHRSFDSGTNMLEIQDQDYANPATRTNTVSGVQHWTADIPTNSILASSPYLRPRERRLAVNSTYVRDTPDDASSLLSIPESLDELDFLNPVATGVEEPPSKSPKIIHDSRTTSFEISSNTFSVSGDAMGQTKQKRLSDPLTSISKISTLLSKVSLTPPSTAASAPRNGMLSWSMLNTPIILPGAFPEYCWQHINENELRRCGSIKGLHDCYSKCQLKTKPTHRSLRADVLSRIIQRSLRPSDIHEVDTFGNSTLHIAAAMLAPPDYIIHLVKLGADVNRLNTAGQTFLHLLTPGNLDQCAELCSLLQILSLRGFNFSQHDDLGQSPLHLLMRPWINTEILRRIITQIDDLPIHSKLSTARDCLGYTINEQLNLQETSSSRQDVDQAIMSLTCETNLPIAHPQDLRLPKNREGGTESHQLPRHYENHPNIETVEDLVRYEQHVDNWRTILTAKHSPWFEDSHGRNGLHCLAEASLVSIHKSLPDQLMAQYTSMKRESRCDNDCTQRKYFLEYLLAIGVDPNNYDKAGNTPLMGFIIHDQFGESDEIITQMITSLLNAGSNICRRNRQGETALHLAVKHGRSAATKALLAAQANIHARTNLGLGILELGQKHATACRQDTQLFAQIMLCLSISASFGAVARPTILDEWGSQWKIPPDKRKKKGFATVKNFIVRKARGRVLKSV